MGISKFAMVNKENEQVLFIILRTALVWVLYIDCGDLYFFLKII